MTARQVRRAAERRARKQARKGSPSVTTMEAPPAVEQIEDIPAVDVAPAPAKPLFTEAKREANRANAQLSSGPRTLEGKAVSSRNNFRHGFTGGFSVLPDEDADAFEQLHLGLELEHQPTEPTEDLLVAAMARHHWLTLRALRLQEDLLAARDLADPATQRQFALYLRYQTTNQRAFHKCLADLLKLKKERQKQERGFESQNRSAAREQRTAEMHELNKVLMHHRIATEDTRKFNLDFERMQSAGTSDLHSVSPEALGAAA